MASPDVADECGEALLESVRSRRPRLGRIRHSRRDELGVFPDADRLELVPPIGTSSGHGAHVSEFAASTWLDAYCCGGQVDEF
jgi:hypothetical protein